MAPKPVETGAVAVKRKAVPTPVTPTPETSDSEISPSGEVKQNVAPMAANRPTSKIAPRPAQAVKGATADAVPTAQVKTDQPLRKVRLARSEEDVTKAAEALRTKTDEDPFPTLKDKIKAATAIVERNTKFYETLENFEKDELAYFLSDGDSEQSHAFKARRFVRFYRNNEFNPSLLSTKLAKMGEVSRVQLLYQENLRKIEVAENEAKHIRRHLRAVLIKDQTNQERELTTLIGEAEVNKAWINALEGIKDFDAPSAVQELQKLMRLVPEEPPAGPDGLPPPPTDSTQSLTEMASRPEGMTGTDFGGLAGATGQEPITPKQGQTEGAIPGAPGTTMPGQAPAPPGQAPPPPGQAPAPPGQAPPPPGQAPPPPGQAPPPPGQAPPPPGQAPPPPGAPPGYVPKIIPCPKCKSEVSIPSPERPVTIQCLNCGLKGNIKK